MYVVTQPTGIFSLILDLIPGLGRGARIRKRLRPTVSKCIMQASRTRRAPRDIPKALSLQSAWVLSTTCVSLMALHTLGQFRRGRVLPRGVCHHVIDIFLFVFFSDPSIFPELVCGRVWLMALWQRWSIIHHQGGWHESEYALWDKFLSATRHKLDSYSFEASFRQIWAQRFLRWNTLAKHVRPLEWLDSTNKT